MAVDIDISRWSITGGVNYTFPANTILPAGRYFVIAANPAAMQATTGYAVFETKAGGYNDLGVRRWFQRKRTLLRGKSPAQILKDDWSPDARGPQKVLDLARSLSLYSAGIWSQRALKDQAARRRSAQEFQVISPDYY